MISVSCFEVGFCESDVCFRGVVVVPCDGGLIYIYNKQTNKQTKKELG